MTCLRRQWATISQHRANHNPEYGTHVTFDTCAEQSTWPAVPLQPRSPAWDDGVVSHLTCPSCGQDIDPSGPGIAYWRPTVEADTRSWVPFIEDLRGTPFRLLHVECFVAVRGLAQLLVVLRARDRRLRDEEYRRWRAALDYGSGHRPQSARSADPSTLPGRDVPFPGSAKP
jgi:hypothetical protein